MAEKWAFNVLTEFKVEIKFMLEQRSKSRETSILGYRVAFFLSKSLFSSQFQNYTMFLFKSENSFNLGFKLDQSAQSEID